MVFIIKITIINLFQYVFITGSLGAPPSYRFPLGPLAVRFSRQLPARLHPRFALHFTPHSTLRFSPHFIVLPDHPPPFSRPLWGAYSGWAHSSPFLTYK